MKNQLAPSARVKFFKSAAAFRKWLQKNHLNQKELLVGYYKKDTGKTAITWSESVEQALCFGWIDGIRRKIDEESYYNRFTPRRPNSNWSDINIKNAERLIQQGLMTEQGLALFNKWKERNTNASTLENNEPPGSPRSLMQLFRANKKAWKYFESCPPFYKNNVTKWVMSAKTDATKMTRLNRVIERCEAGIR